MKKILILILILTPLLVQPAQDSKLESKLFYSLGHFSAKFLYQTYLNIGLISDAWVNNAYSPEDTKSLLQNNLSQLQVSKETLVELSEFSIADANRRGLLVMASIVDDLYIQAEAMLNFIVSRNDEDKKKYKLSRERSWEKIKSLLGLD